jgi:hypothetical protein
MLHMQHKNNTGAAIGAIPMAGFRFAGNSPAMWGGMGALPRYFLLDKTLNPDLVS